MANFLLNFDFAILKLITRWSDPLANQIFYGISLFGEKYVIFCICLVAIIWFWKTGFSRYILPFIITVGGSTLTTAFLKEIVDRSRPADMFAYYKESGQAFPSGHATVAVALYGFLIYFIYKNFSGWKRNFGVGGLSILIILIGFSRLYMGVHYLSDVVAGYIVGIVWLGVGVNIGEKIIERISLDKNQGIKV